MDPTSITRPANWTPQWAWLLVFLAWSWVDLAQAQRTERPGSDPAEAQADDSQEQEESEKSDQDGPILAIVGANIYTVTGSMIRSGTVLIQDGKILEVGQDLEVPEGAEVIDAAGKSVTPGFIALNTSRVGIESSTSGDAKDLLNPFDRNLKYCLGSGITSGCTFISSRSSSRGRAEETLETETDSHADHDHGHEDSHGHDHDHGLILGDLTREQLALLTPIDSESDLQRVEQTPPSDFASLANLLKADPSSAEWHGLLHGVNGELAACCELAMQAVPTITAPVPKPAGSTKSVYLKFSYGEINGMLAEENPFYVSSGSSLSKPSDRYAFRENVKKARDYLEELAAYEKKKAEGDKKARAPRKTLTDDFLKLVKREIPLLVSESSVDGMRDLIALAQELDLRLAFTGAHESWVIAVELGQAGVSVVYTPRSKRRGFPGREDQTGSSIETSAKLEAAGVPFALSALSTGVSLGGIAGRDLTSLALEAAFAMRGGCSEETALEALTIVPARMLGLEDRVGSIEPGKDADLLILDGPPLDYRTYVKTAIVNGQICYEQAEDRVFPIVKR